MENSIFPMGSHVSDDCWRGFYLLFRKPKALFTNASTIKVYIVSVPISLRKMFWGWQNLVRQKNTGAFRPKIQFWNEFVQVQWKKSDISGHKLSFTKSRKKAFSSLVAVWAVGLIGPSHLGRSSTLSFPCVYPSLIKMYSFSAGLTERFNRLLAQREFEPMTFSS